MTLKDTKTTENDSDYENCHGVNNCVDFTQTGDFEVVKAYYVGERVLLSAHSKVTKIVTTRNQRVELVEDIETADYFKVFQKITKKAGVEKNDFNVCFTKKIEGKRYCISPDLTCIQYQPDRIDLVLDDLPASWDGTAKHIPKDQYGCWFKYTSKLSNGDDSIFQSFYSDEYYLRVSDSLESLYLERQVNSEGRLSDDYKFNYYSKQNISEE